MLKECTRDKRRRKTKRNSRWKFDKQFRPTLRVRKWAEREAGKFPHSVPSFPIPKPRTTKSGLIDPPSQINREPARRSSDKLRCRGQKARVHGPRANAHARISGMYYSLENHRHPNFVRPLCRTKFPRPKPLPRSTMWSRPRA